MKITILANRDLASNYALNLLLPRLIEKHQVRVFLSSRVGRTSSTPAELLELKFFEQTLFNELLFPALGSSVESELLGFKALGRWIGHEVETLNRINTSKGLDRLRDKAPDLILSIRYGGILKAKAIAVPPLGVLNLHSGRLPQYKGIMATFRALLAGDRELGTTLHFISDASIDTGAVVGQTRLAVEPGRSYLWHVLQLYPDGCKLMLDAVERLGRGEAVEARPQEGGGAYYSLPTEEDLAAFHAAGYRLFDHAEIVEFAERYLPRDHGTSRV